MSLELSRLEADLIGDLAQDGHALYEVFEFVRVHQKPGRADLAHVLPLGRRLLQTWIDRGWLALAPNPEGTARIASLDELVPLVDHLGALATEYFSGAPWLRLTERAGRDVRRAASAV